MNRSELLECAKNTVCAERADAYGKPEDNFASIAIYWTEYIRRKYGMRIPFAGNDIAVMMILLKIARMATGRYKEDNWIDIAGYAACGAEIEDIGGNNNGKADYEKTEEA